MNFSLSTIANAVSASFTVAEDIADVYTLLKPVALDLLTAFETAYSSATNAGATKLAAVLGALEALAKQSGADWTDTLKASFSDLIAKIKAAWNGAVSAVTAVTASGTAAAA